MQKLLTRLVVGIVEALPYVVDSITKHTEDLVNDVRGQRVKGLLSCLDTRSFALGRTYSILFLWPGGVLEVIGAAQCPV